MELSGQFQFSCSLINYSIAYYTMYILISAVWNVSDDVSALPSGDQFQNGVDWYIIVIVLAVVCALLVTLSAVVVRRNRLRKRRDANRRHALSKWVRDVANDKSILCTNYQQSETRRGVILDLQRGAATYLPIRRKRIIFMQKCELYQSTPSGHNDENANEMKTMTESIHERIPTMKVVDGYAHNSNVCSASSTIHTTQTEQTSLMSLRASLFDTVEYDIPLDARYEIARDRLKFVKQIGEGAFGRVALAEMLPAPDANEEVQRVALNGEVQRVAMKMLKEDATEPDLLDLLRELELMKLIGTHKNIINLIGCCTQQGTLFFIKGME